MAKNKPNELWPFTIPDEEDLDSSSFVCIACGFVERDEQDEVPQLCKCGEWFSYVGIRVAIQYAIIDCNCWEPGGRFFKE